MVVPWLIVHAGVIVSLFEIGSDRRTAYERSRLHRTRGRANKLEAKFFSGVYLELRLGTNEMYISSATVCCQSRSDQAKE